MAAAPYLRPEDVLSNPTHDLVVIGAGPGGYVAAARAAALGLRTAVVEADDRLGGTCLLRGCIPTKALLQSARTYELCRKGARTFGVEVGDVGFDWAKVRKRQEMVVRKGALGVAALQEKRGVEVVRGRGCLDGPGRVVVDGGQVLEAPKVIVATGSRPASLPGVTVDGERVLTSDHLLNLDRVPESLVVLGAGAVGVEFADVMNAFGCRVTLVELLPRILPLEDPECSEVVAKALGRRGVKIHAGHRASDVAVTDEGVTLQLSPEAGGDPVPVEAASLLVAAGRSPNTSDLGLETTAAVVDRRGFIQTDPLMETAEAGLFAIGDVVATPQLAHAASAEALVAAARAAGGEPRPVNPDHIPGCTYCSPEVASVGLTEAEARARGYEVTVGRHDLAAVGKASILNEPHGFVKIVADAETGRPLGVHMVGAHATDLIGEACAVLGAEIDLPAWSRAVHPHPTLCEAVGEAVLDALGEAVHG